jgi:hypothetical protein
MIAKDKETGAATPPVLVDTVRLVCTAVAVKWNALREVHIRTFLTSPVRRLVVATPVCPEKALPQ